MPLCRNESVQRPQIKVLILVKSKPRLVRCQPSQETEIDIAVVAGDVGVGVVNNIVTCLLYTSDAADE